MEVSRLPVTPVDLTEHSSAAVAAIHKSMVTLRSELLIREEKIRQLEDKLRDKEEQQGEKKSFEDIFDLHIESQGAMEGDQVDFDQILLYEEAAWKEERVRKEEREKNEEKERKEEKERQAKKDKESLETTYDPIMAFVLSEEEEEVSEKDGSKIDLVPFRDIQFHVPPTDCDVRPILKESSSQVESCGSQTDITAVVVGGKPRERNWSSEPHLASWTNPGHHANRQVTVTFKIPEREVIGADKEPSLQEESSDSDTDTLLTEAEEFIRVSKTKLVTTSDWLGIKQKSKYINRHNKTKKLIEPKKNYPFIPHHLHDLKLGETVRAIIPSNKLVTAIVRYIGGPDVIGIESLEEHISHENATWKKYFQSHKGQGYLVKLEKIVMCLQ